AITVLRKRMRVVPGSIVVMSGRHEMSVAHAAASISAVMTLTRNPPRFGPGQHSQQVVKAVRGARADLVWFVDPAPVGGCRGRSCAHPGGCRFGRRA